MLDIMARGHNAADGALVQVEYALNHPPLLRVENLRVVMIHQHRGCFRIQFGVLFLPA